MLKPNMVVPGKKWPDPGLARADRGRNYPPVQTDGACRRAGHRLPLRSQADVEATANLNAINAAGNLPWSVTFSYGRALQAAPQKAWSGKAANVSAAQAAFAHRAKMNGLATTAAWKQDLEAMSKAA